MATEMWQRLRAARRAAGLTQKQLAQALGLTRAGYAWMESARPEGRVSPMVRQLRTIAEKTKVPLEMLVSDKTGDGEIWRTVNAGAKGSQLSPEEEDLPEPTIEISGRMRENFWRAVELVVAGERPALAHYFDIEVGSSGMRAGFFDGKHLVCFAGPRG
jgi:transcriptional regulator with XRE-family HTH domain